MWKALASKLFRLGATENRAGAAKLDIIAPVGPNRPAKLEFVLSRKSVEASSPDPMPSPLKQVALRTLVAGTLLSGGLFIGFCLPYFWSVDRWLQGEFGRLTWQEPTRVYARPLLLRAGEPMAPAQLREELAAADYREGARGEGSYSQQGEVFAIHTRDFRDAEGAIPGRLLQVRLAAGKVQWVRSATGDALASAKIDPARIGTFYGSDREERRLLRLQDVPAELLATLQAVEDRSFKHHRGVDVLGILRALWANMRAGEVRQGGSTITQQLVRNLYLSRAQNLGRKLREAAYALVIEARFDKGRILEAYINQVYLGQQGAQAIHGLGAAAEFWFGRDLDQLSSAQNALLIGLIRGPSHLDPRRHPERAKARRDRVIDTMLETGIIDESVAKLARAEPLGVSRRGRLTANRHPAFMQLVHQQLAADYPAERLNGAGLSVMTTLAPSVQREAERVVAEQLDKLAGKQAEAVLEAALVFTDTRDGTIEAVVGGRDESGQGFNRALDARRPVGSLLKPFVYLLALAQPERFSLALQIDDAPISLRVSGGKTWSPENSDGKSHGKVTLLQALAQSYNQATVRLGLEVGVERLARLIEVLIDVAPPANPSLVLGALDLSPLQVAQLYQFLASGGQIQPLRAVHAVLDAEGRPLSRYARATPAADPGDALATRLVTWALQETARIGTAQRLQRDGLGAWRPAGKTGTSNDSRDSWFAGYTGSRLGVVWVGDDRNRPTGLYGSTGAMRLWSAVMQKAPGAVLPANEEAFEWAWIAVDEWARTDPECAGAASYPFVPGYSPGEYRGCTFARVRDWFNWESQ